MPESLLAFFSSRFFMPHGHCYLWKPALVWLQVVSNGLIGLSYFAISATLAYLVAKVGDLPFKAMYVAFGVFIVTCGFTHFFDVYVIWQPAYWVDGSIRAVTAVASVGTAIMLPPLVPKALALARGAKAAHDRGIKLETMVKELEAAYERTKELDQLKTQFFANVSHELRTPLTLILAPVERLLRTANLEGDVRGDLDVVARNARTLLKHVDDLLDVSKLEAGEVRVRYASVDVAQLVTAMAGQFEAAANDRRIDLRVDAPAELRAEVDPDKLDRILLNLLSNAFKFTPEGGAIACRLSGERDTLELEVADSGPGIPAAQRAAAFERFRQLDGGATRRFGGTGLGLAIVKDFVDLHRGTVEIQDAPLGGALFRVRLPRVAPAGSSGVDAARPEPTAPTTQLVRQELESLRASATAARRATPPIEEAAGQAVDRPLVLVVEDNAEMADLVAKMLAPEFAVDRAGNGHEALERMRERRPDLVVSDIMMPVMSGDALVREMRRQKAFDDIPVIMLTAKADAEVRVEMLRGGAQDYVAKPFAFEELRARVAVHMAQKRTRDVLARELASTSGDLERLARDLAAKGRDLAQALAALQAAHEETQRALRVKAQFLDLVSHELRTPLNVLTLQVHLLTRKRNETAPAEERTILAKMDDTVARLTDLVDSLLESARIGSGRLEITPVSLDLTALANEVLGDHRDVAEKKGLALELDAPPSLPPLRSDARLVRLVVGNLVENAVKFTATGGVTLKLAFEPGRHVVTVTDTGPGIPAGQLDRVFDPFTHVEPIEGKHTPGFGLGLTIVREAVHALGGAVRARSSVGVGSEFTVQLPDLSGHDEAPALDSGQ